MKEGAPIRFMVLGLPIGLLILGVLSMLFTYSRRDAAPLDPNEAERLEAAALKRRPVSREDLANSLEILTRRIGERHLGKPEALESAALWLESTLGGGNIGYLVERHSYEAGEAVVRNLVAELPGRSRRAEIVVVGAHYDTVPGSPGANDNGSGIAALVSLARAFAGDPQGRTVRFVAFVNEEAPHFQTETMGSLAYASRCHARGERIAAMLCLDTVGCYREDEGSQRTPEGLEDDFPATGNFLAFVGDENSSDYVDSAKAAFAAVSSIPALGGAFPGSVPEAGWSDHWSFWQMGYPAVMVTDTGPFRSPHYHSPEDTADRIDLDRLEDATKGFEAIVRAWANP